MEKFFVIFDLETNSYYTGKYWNIPWSKDIKDAEVYLNDSTQIINSLYEDEEDAKMKKVFENKEFLEIKTIYRKND